MQYEYDLTYSSKGYETGAGRHLSAIQIRHYTGIACRVTLSGLYAFTESF